VLALWTGCSSVAPTAPSAPPPSAVATGTNAAATASQTLAAPSIPPPPAEGYAWDELARLSAANSSEARVLQWQAEVERHQTDVDTGWRNPQMRFGTQWGDEDESTAGRSGYRTYPEETGSPSRPFTSNSEWGDKDYNEYSGALRIYTVNPFVNRWLRRRGAAAAAAKEAESQEVRYAIFCEVKSLCLEAEVLRKDIDYLGQIADLREQIRATRNEQAAAGFASEIDLIRAETKLASLRSEIREKRTARQQLIRRIAVLAGIPVEQVRLRSPDFGQAIAPAYLDAAVLTDLAFVRRPDLQRALLEKAAAEHGLRAAKAGQIPWIEYVEGTFGSEREHAKTTEENVSGSDRSTRDETDWGARVAVTLPVFNWLGDEIKLNRARLSAAETRAQGLYDRIRREVDGVLEDYQDIRSERDRLAVERERLCASATTRIDALAKEPAVRREDVLAAREELIDYQRVCMRVDHEYLRYAQYVETVSGGTLTPTR
jgi:outer membrane protein TolC